jgi:DNA-binding LacI/PurR family transcriptional regulator
VIGFDKVAIALSTRPPLTTVRIDRTGLDRIALLMLLDRIGHPDTIPAAPPSAGS